MSRNLGNKQRERSPIPLIEVPRCVLDDTEMSPAVLRVYLAMLANASPTIPRYVRLSLRQIGDQLGISRQAVSRSAHELVDLGYLAIMHPEDEAGDELTDRWLVRPDPRVPPGRVRRRTKRYGAMPHHRVARRQSSVANEQLGIAQYPVAR